MKFIKVLCCILAICLTFSGCNFSIASSIDDLLSPVAPFGENASVQKVMDSYVNCTYSLKTPTYGDYITSYIFKDIDNDGVDEALCFYEPSDNLGSIFMALLQKTKDEWSVVCSIKGNGKDIYSVNFSDIDGDSTFEIIACWDAISNSTTHNMSIYKLNSGDGNYSLEQLDGGVAVNNYHCIDLDNDAKQEIFVLINDSTNSVSAKGQLYSIKKSKFNLLGETKLDGHITNYTKISSDIVDGKTRIYADAITSTGDSMITEIIYWSEHYDNIVSPFYSYSTGFNKATNRSAMVNSMDIDNDGIIEIPLDANITNMPENVKAIDWKKYKNTVLVHNNYSLFIKDDNYLVLIPEEIFDKISVSYDAQTRTLTVSDAKSNTVLYSITLVLKSLYNENDYRDYEFIMEHKGYYYLAKFGENSSIDTQQLKDLVKSY